MRLPGPSPRRPRARGRRYTCAALVACLLLMSGGPASADPGQSAGPRAKLDRLDQRSARLAEAYDGELVALEDVRRSARRAAVRARDARRELERARRRVAALAAEKYKNGSAATFRIVMSGKPGSVLDRATTVDYLAERTAQQVETVRRLAARASRSQRAARARVGEVRSKVERLEQNKARVQRLIERYEERAAELAERVESSESSSQAPAPGDITPRMSQVYSELAGEFGDEYGILCYRPDDSGEHPEGRACDFMLSSGGAVPSGEQVQRGYDIAEYAVDNAERLGIMYVIYRQRIWDIRCGCGWEYMEDRGSVTANHVDHVHISVF